MPLCCVTIKPGTTSRISPVRSRGRASSSAAPTTPCDAERALADRVVPAAEHDDVVLDAGRGAAAPRRRERSPAAAASKAAVDPTSADLYPCHRHLHVNFAAYLAPRIGARFENRAAIGFFTKRPHSKDSYEANRQFGCNSATLAKRHPRSERSRSPCCARSGQHRAARGARRARRARETPDLAEHDPGHA